MCFSKPKLPSVAPQIIAPDTEEANRAADIEAALRRRRAGAAANVLTGPMGLPVSSKLGKPA